MKVTITMQAVLDKMERGKWYCAYDLRCNMSTLEALRKRGLVKRKVGMGQFFSPRTDIEWRKR